MQYTNRTWPRQQQGLSKWGWLFFLAMMGLLATSALRLGPHYIDFRVVQVVADRLPEGEVHSEWTRTDITDHFKKQFRIESFRIPVKDVIKIERNREETVVDINYEVREHLFYNIDVVLVFNDRRVFQ
jgi:uncharacterized protein DUF4845